MRSEQEVRELKKSIESVDKNRVGKEGFVTISDKGWQWLDCLDWVLTNPKKKR